MISGAAIETGSMSGHVRSLLAASEICREAIGSVSPAHLVTESVRVVENGENCAQLMCVGDREYPLNQ